jgi:hypothetical protein
MLSFYTKWHLRLWTMILSGWVQVEHTCLHWTGSYGPQLKEATSFTMVQSIFKPVHQWLQNSCTQPRLFIGGCYLLCIFKAITQIEAKPITLRYYCYIIYTPALKTTLFHLKALVNVQTGFLQPYHHRFVLQHSDGADPEASRSWQ